MKNKLTIISRFGIVVIGSFCFATVSTAQEGGRYMRNEMQRQPPGRMVTPTQMSQPTATGALSARDRSFMKDAAKGGMMEVEWGKWATQKGQSADVKKFGNRMVTDHSKANSELMSLAATKGVKLPGEKISGKWKSDKDYMDMMLKDHEKDLAEFQDEAKNGSDPDLKKFADKTSKVIQKHLELAKETQSKLK